MWNKLYKYEKGAINYKSHVRLRNTVGQTLNKIVQGELKLKDILTIRP